jgi:hypothetical protein
MPVRSAPEGLVSTDSETTSEFPDRQHIDLSRDPTPGHPDHALPDDAEAPHPLVDLSRDPTPGQPDHALPEDDSEDDSAGNGG